MNSVLTSIITIGGVAGIGYIIFSIFGGGSGKLISSIQDMFKKKKAEMQPLEDKQEELVKKIAKNKKIAKEKREEVKKIREEANKKIVETLEKEDLASLLMEEEAIWEE
jgi:predicted PurR-regulated permease PerM